jgi:hypothetical protein
VLQHEQQLPAFQPLLFDVLGLSQRMLAWLAVFALGKLLTAQQRHGSQQQGSCSIRVV